MKCQYYSPLRYPGGKTSLADFLSKTIEKNLLNNCRYIEGFAGGAGAALKLLMLEKVNDIYLNDKDEFIYCFWKSVLNDTEAICKLIQDSRMNMKEWNKRHKILTSCEVIRNFSELEIGFTGFFLNRVNRSGILAAGPIGGKDQSGDWKLDARFNRKDLVNRIQKIARYSERIHLFNWDIFKFIPWIQRQNFPSNEVLCYLDPPYVDQGKNLYQHYFTLNQHKKLAELLQRRSEYHWIVSYDEHPIIHSSYKEVIKNIFEFNYYANRTKVGRELMIASKKLILPKEYEHYSRTKVTLEQNYKSKAV